MGRYHLSILARLLQAAGIWNKSLSTLQCKFLEMCMKTMCNQVAKLFSVLCLLIWFGCVVRCFHNGEEASRFGVLIGFGSLVGGIARLGTGKECAWYMIATDQSTCKRRLLKRSANTRGTFMELEAGAHRSARR